MEISPSLTYRFRGTMNGVATKQYQILCVDDEPSNLMLRKLVLQSAGFSVLTASSGKEGVDLFRSNPVDALVIDFSMPDMDGGMVAIRIKELKPRVPIIMLSAYPGAQDGLDGAVDLFIEKGGDPKQLLSRIESLVKIRDHLPFTSGAQIRSRYVCRFLAANFGLFRRRLRASRLPANGNVDQNSR